MVFIFMRKQNVLNLPFRGFLDKEEVGQFWKLLNHPDGIFKHIYTVYFKLISRLTTI